MNEMYGRKIERFDFVLLLMFLKNVKNEKKLVGFSPSIYIVTTFQPFQDTTELLRCQKISFCFGGLLDVHCQSPKQNGNDLYRTFV